ncbi:hypothetical protein NIES4071_85420 [Calothrix sp. NIES-4071]|nr:hypothetical protein NIES4071_85420 [Calothrix sp. NIES-4071]BAZ62809.1 hypothetical protein NIES4105_85350 [Calothrix sp. NIES-4105]
MTDLIYEEFAKNYLRDLLSPYLQVELGRQVIPKHSEPKEEDSYRQFGKGLFSALLSPYGTVEIDKELPPAEPKVIPIYCTPNIDTQIPDDLGLLKRFLNKNTLFHPYFNEIEEFDIHDCLLVILNLFKEYDARDERYTLEFDNFLKEHSDYLDEFKDEDEDEDDYEHEDYAYRDAKDLWIREHFFPFSWVIVPTVSESLLDGFRADPSEDWEKGIYFMAPIFRMGIIAIDELPRTYETLWLRLLTKGEVLLQAIDEIEALPQGNPLRFKALNSLMGLYTSLQASQDLDAEDENLIARLSQIYRQEMN